MLELRMMSEEVLVNYNLGELHVSEEDKSLSLVGECGKPIVVIHGIKIGKLTKSNREYAIELLNRFLDKHSIKIEEYIKNKKALTVIEEPKKEIKLPFAGSISLSYSQKKKCAYFSGVYSISLTVGDIEEFLSYKKDIEVFEKDYIKYLDYLDELSDLNKKLNELNTCDI